MLMAPPKYTQAKSKRITTDFRVDEVEKFKAENPKVIRVLAELAAKKAELVDKTPFDSFEDNIILQIIDTKITEIYSLINNNPQLTR